MAFTLQIRMPGDSGLPEDIYINTFHFAGDATEINAAEARGQVALFFAQDHPTHARDVAAFLSQVIDRSSPAEVRCYEITTGPAGPPFYESTISLPAPEPGSVPLPEECAIVSSQVGGLVNGKPARARQYLGPLNNFALSMRSDGHTQVSLMAREVIGLAAKNLADGMSPSNLWSTLTQTPLTVAMTAIQSGFVDNAFDTQRRRGPDATERVTWIAA